MEILKEIKEANEVFRKKYGEELEKGRKGQTPGILRIACSDSRVPVEAMHRRPYNNVFEVRNAGNLVAPAKETIRYAIEHLPIEWIVVEGHTECGAVYAAMDGKAGGALKELEELYRKHEQILRGRDRKLQNAWLAMKNVDRQIEQLLQQEYVRIRLGNGLNIIGLINEVEPILTEQGGYVLVNVNGRQDLEDSYIKYGRYSLSET